MLLNINIRVAQCGRKQDIWVTALQYCLFQVEPPTQLPVQHSPSHHRTVTTTGSRRPSASWRRRRGRRRRRRGVWWGRTRPARMTAVSVTSPAPWRFSPAGLGPALPVYPRPPVPPLPLLPPNPALLRRRPSTITGTVIMWANNWRISWKNAHPTFKFGGRKK